MTTVTAARHVAPRNPTRLRARIALIPILLAVVLAIALVAGHGTLALWNAQAKASGGGTVRSGTATVVVGNLPAMYQTAVGPGSSTVGAFTVQNTGSVPLAIRVATSSTKVSYVASTPDSTVLGALTMHLASVSSAPACTAGLSGASGPISTFDTGSGYYTLPAGQKATACLEVSLSSTAPQSVSGAVVDFTVTVTGVQVAS